MAKARILVVDDEPTVLKVLVTRLQLSGYQVCSATNGEEALESFHRDSPDLIVLDVMLPKMDGFAVCRRIRAESVVPIILLTSLERFSERVAGLDLGFDDYLSKPFSPKELEARIATVLRRMTPTVSVTQTKEAPSFKGVMRFGSLIININKGKVSRAGQIISLTYSEFTLLKLLFEEPGKVFLRAEILEQLWGYPPRRAADLRVVDKYVARLRNKLEPDPRNPELILTVKGKGYKSKIYEKEEQLEDKYFKNNEGREIKIDKLMREKEKPIVLKLENFTEQANKVLNFAQQEARIIGHNWCGTEHILLGLIKEDNGLAAKVLKSLGLNFLDTRVEVDKIIGRGNGFVELKIPFTKRGERVLERAMEEAIELGGKYVGTEHLLLSLIKEVEGIACSILENIGIDIEKINQRILNLIPKKILLIEDDPEMRDLISKHLENIGFDVKKAEDGIKGQELAFQCSPDLIILDLMLPSIDGLTLSQRLKKDERTLTIPILMITALEGLKEKTAVFNLSPDDFITKPFDLEELDVRIKVLLRRINTAQLDSTNQQEILNYGPLTLVPERFEAIWFENSIRLTHLMFELLHCLLQRHGQTLSPALILKEVWGYEPDDDNIETVRVHVRHLRSKLEPDPRNPIYIKTIYGKGYRLELPSLT